MLAPVDLSPIVGLPVLRTLHLYYYTGWQERADKVKYVDAYDAALYFTEARAWKIVPVQGGNVQSQNTPTPPIFDAPMPTEPIFEPSDDLPF